MDEKLPQRRHNRLEGYDYSQNGAYFLTICVEGKKKIFGEIVTAGIVGATCGRPVFDSPRLCPTKCGEIAEKELIKVSGIYKNIWVDKSVVMPNHIHLKEYQDTWLYIDENPICWAEDEYYS